MIHRIIMQDGSIRWQWWNDHAFFDQTGRLVEYQSVGKDITDWKQAEENLMDREHRLETLGMSIPGVIYQLEMTVDNHYRFPYVRGKITGVSWDNTRRSNGFSGNLIRIYFS